MHPAPPRRAAGLLIAAAVGLSSALVGIPGVAAAAPSGWTFSDADTGPIVVPAGTCAIDWSIAGSRGGANSDGEAATPPMVTTVRTAVGPGATFTLAVGAPGADAVDGGAGGINPVDAAWSGGPAFEPDSGGGGAASVVSRNGSPYLVSHGTMGAAGAQYGGGAPGYADAGPLPIDVVPPSSPPAPGPVFMADGESQGYVTGEGVACGTFAHNPLVPGPGVPSVIPGPEQLTVMFQPRPGGFGTVPLGTTWEYSLDGTTWTPTAASQVYFPSGPTHQFRLPGLTDGTPYLVRLRATNANGVSEAVSAYGESTPYTRPGRPTAVTVETRPSALAFSWAPPAVPGTYALTGYTVFVMEADRTEDDPGPYWECTTGADARGCVIGVAAGEEYVAYVSALAGKVGGHTNEGDYEAVASGVVPGLPVPETVPRKDGDLFGAAGAVGTVTAGEPVVLKGSGFAPNSTVQATIYSTPTPLGTYVTDAAGAFEISVTVPASLASGQHTLVVCGVDADGNVRNVLAGVTVDGTEDPGAPADDPATDDGTDDTDGTDDGTDDTAEPAGPGGLPNTGASIGLPALGGLVALAAGGGLLFAARRRTAA